MPSETSIEQQLRELHAPRVEPPNLEAEAEQALLAAWAARYGEGRSKGESDSGPGFGLLGLLLAHRLAVAIATLLVVVVGACVLPTSYEIPLGLSIEIRALDGEELPVHEIAKYVRDRSDAGEVDVLMRESVHHGGAPQAEMLIRLWDQNLALGELEPELREQFPVLAHAEIVETALEGEIETIWARRLAHRAFRVSLREADVEQAREHLLIQLQARGFSEDEVVVKVRDREDGHREVEVQIERRHIGEGEDLPETVDELGLGPGFEWVMDPHAHDESVDLHAPPSGEPVRIHVQATDDE